MKINQFRIAEYKYKCISFLFVMCCIPSVSHSNEFSPDYGFGINSVLTLPNVGSLRPDIQRAFALPQEKAVIVLGHLMEGKQGALPRCIFSKFSAGGLDKSFGVGGYLELTAFSSGVPACGFRSAKRVSDKQFASITAHSIGDDSHVYYLSEISSSGNVLHSQKIDVRGESPEFFPVSKGWFIVSVSEKEKQIRVAFVDEYGNTSEEFNLGNDKVFPINFPGVVRSVYLANHEAKKRYVLAVTGSKKTENGWDSVADLFAFDTKGNLDPTFGSNGFVEIRLVDPLLSAANNRLDWANIKTMVFDKSGGATLGVYGYGPESRVLGFLIRIGQDGKRDLSYAQNTGAVILENGIYGFDFNSFVTLPDGSTLYGVNSGTKISKVTWDGKRNFVKTATHQHPYSDSVLSDIIDNALYVCKNHWALMTYSPPTIQKLMVSDPKN